MKGQVPYLLIVASVCLLIAAGCAAPPAPAPTPIPPTSTPAPPSPTAVPPTPVPLTPPPPTATMPSPVKATLPPALSRTNVTMVPGIKTESGTITSQALADNLLGDPATRTYYVLLPSDYDTSEKRYPVVYVMHGWWTLPGFEVTSFRLAWEDALQSGNTQEIIFVFPDANNKLHGSWYLSSSTIGDYETYLTQELVGAIDAAYRTIPNRASRGITGCGMGGNGSMGLALKYPNVYGVAAPASGFYDWKDLDLSKETASALTKLPSDFTVTSNPEGEAMWLLSIAAATAPDPDSPPFYAEMPFAIVDGKAQIVPAVRDKMAAADSVHDIQRYLAQPERLNALLLYHNVADDPGEFTEVARSFDRLLTGQGIEHEYLESNIAGFCQHYQGPAVKFMSDHLVGE